MRNDLANRALNAVVSVMGEPIAITRGQSTAQVSGVFQASHVGLDPETGVQVRSTQPVVLVDRENLPWDPKQGDTVVARSTTYRVRDAQPDGHTGWLLMLHRTQQ
ncbi:MAG: hypothetical protein RJA63_157 [Pseudomonadota bacterium]|jgi:hypothetical protein